MLFHYYRGLNNHTISRYFMVIITPQNIYFSTITRSTTRSPARRRLGMSDFRLYADPHNYPLEDLVLFCISYHTPTFPRDSCLI